jgi:hypothetical protein
MLLFSLFCGNPIMCIYFSLKITFVAVHIILNYLVVHHYMTMIYMIYYMAQGLGLLVTDSTAHLRVLWQGYIPFHASYNCLDWEQVASSFNTKTILSK